jgi:DNA-binding CsgD family transcriptional regulator
VAVADDRAGRARRRVECLTDREREVAVSVGRGSSNAEIATALRMSIATVKAHISHIFTKLDATNRVQVAIAMHEADLFVAPRRWNLMHHDYIPVTMHQVPSFPHARATVRASTGGPEPVARRKVAADAAVMRTVCARPKPIGRSARRRSDAGCAGASGAALLSGSW